MHKELYIVHTVMLDDLICLIISYLPESLHEHFDFKHCLVAMWDGHTFVHLNFTQFPKGTEFKNKLIYFLTGTEFTNCCPPLLRFGWTCKWRRERSWTRRRTPNCWTCGSTSTPTLQWVPLCYLLTFLYYFNWKQQFYSFIFLTELMENSLFFA